jgi:hypothetical protein
MTLPESFRLTGPLSGHLIFLKKRVLGVSRTSIIHSRGDWYYSASGLVLLPSPPPISCSSYILTLFLVLSYISPHSPAASRRVGAPLCFNVTLYIYYIYYLGVSPLLPFPPNTNLFLTPSPPPLLSIVAHWRSVVDVARNRVYLST